MAVFATYIPFSEINKNKPSTIDEFHNAIVTFPRMRLMHLCSAMNALLRSDTEPINRKAHDSLVRTLFDEPTAAALLSSREDVRFVFHRQQILFVAKTAIMSCSDLEQNIDPARFRELGKVFLMAGDHLPILTKKPDPLEDKFAFFAAQLLPVQEASGFHRFDHKMARSFAMLGESIRQLREGNRRYWDIPAIFEQVSGVPLLTFQSLLFGALTKFLQFDPNAYVKDPRSYGLNRGWFASTKVEPKLIERFLECVSATADKLKDEFGRANWGTNDFTPFRDRPLFRDGEYYFLLDFAFLAEKFETGPFWSVHNSLREKNDRTDLHSFWGEVFERYCCNTLETTCNPTVNVFHDSPNFQDQSKGQVCDAVIVCGTSAVFLEIKGATFSSRAKYAGDYHLLASEIDHKLVQDENGDAKAVRQLKRAMELSFDRANPEKVDRLDLRLIDTVYPLIITRDDIGSVFAINGYIGLKFDAAVDRRKVSVRVTPIFCMNAEDLERLSAYFSDTPLSDLLHAHHRACKGRGDYLLTSYFATDGNRLLHRLGGRRPETIEKAWKELTDTGIAHLGLTP
jgi:hypothetical protein